jgi:hypothetical protein
VEERVVAGPWTSSIPLLKHYNLLLNLAVQLNEGLGFLKLYIFHPIKGEITLLIIIDLVLLFDNKSNFKPL